MMCFSLIDKIIDVHAEKRITAIKQLMPDEPYLRDHFPGFPVMPGVLMLEAMYQTAAWLLMFDNSFSTGMPRLKATSKVRYGNFVQPGDVLTITANMVKRQEDQFTLFASGVVNDTTAVSARLVLEENWPEQMSDPSYQITDFRTEFDRLFKPAAELVKTI